MKIYRVTDKEFLSFGKTVENPAAEELVEISENVSMPETGSNYEAAFSPFETESNIDFFTGYFGQMPIQIGVCRGHNSLLNALEWHKSVEVNVALTDFIMLLGKTEDMTGYIYDSKNLKAFLVRKGETVEIYPTTLHFCPLETSETGFMSAVVLPKGSNTPLDKPAADKKNTAKNKWLICHKENQKMIAMGRVIGVIGKNIEIK